MNKKFSTLMASLLLAGGVFSDVYAVQLTAAEPGTFYKLRRAASITADAWVKNSDNYYLTTVESTPGVQLNANDYWQIIKNENGSYTLKNLNGETLTFQSSSDVYFYNLGSIESEEAAKGYTQLSSQSNADWWALDAHQEVTNDFWNFVLQSTTSLSDTPGRLLMQKLRLYKKFQITQQI